MEEWTDLLYLYKEMIDYKNISLIYLTLENNRNILTHTEPPQKTFYFLDILIGKNPKTP